jgi:hypothetical protein
VLKDKIKTNFVNFNELRIGGEVMINGWVFNIYGCNE